MRASERKREATWRRTSVKLGLALAAAVFLSALARGKGGAALLREDFDSRAVGKAVADLEGWRAFAGFPGKEAPSAVVARPGGEGASNALALWHREPFRADNYGVHVPLPEPVREGVVWMQCRFRPPPEWTAGFYFDARAGRQVVARIAGERYRDKDDPTPVLRWHASWTNSYWRLYTKTDLADDRWYTLTARLDLGRGSYAAWVDGQTLGEDVPLCADAPITHLHVSGGGTKDAPALLDDLQVTREAPAGREFRALLPTPKEGHLFRFAAVGDPQIGFAGYEADKERFRHAVRQINESGAEAVLILGDMVHDKDREQAYKDLKALAEGLKAPCHYVRGNHETKDLYRKHFHPQLDYAVTRKGFRFVFIDAEGNHEGLSEGQLAEAARQFRQAAARGEEIVACLHVSPWQDNERGRTKYNQIGEGRDRLRALLAEHKALFCLSGHYHRGLWHAREGALNYLVLGGTSRVRFGHTGWCLFDVYPDRVEVFEKPLFHAYVRGDDRRFYQVPYGRWDDYAEMKERHPYLQQGPLIVPRNRPASSP